MTIKVKKSDHGRRVKCDLLEWGSERKSIDDGRLVVLDGGEVFVAQNISRGKYSSCSFGYDYTFFIGDNFAINNTPFIDTKTFQFTDEIKKTEETMELKVYDKVYLKKDAGSYKKGDCLTYWGGTNFSQSGKSNLSVGKWERSEFFTKEKPAGEFKVGDVVVGVGKVDGQVIDGKIGTVIKVDLTLHQPFGIEFEDRFILGHTCDGAGKDEHCWYVQARDIKLAETNLPTHPRTFRTVKESPEVKVGAVFQLFHDMRGNAMYKLLPESNDLNKSEMDVYYSAKTVETQPEYFEEVFKLKVEKWVTKSEYASQA